jgi:site-specific recombinase XerD
MGAEVIYINNRKEMVEEEYKTEAEIIKIPKYKKNGELKKTKSNAKEGVSSRVYPLKTEEEVSSIIRYWKDKGEKAEKPSHKRIADRNVALLTVGFNVGIRGHDLLELDWLDIFCKDGSFKEDSIIQEEKTEKFKDLIFNDSCKAAIMEYVNKYDIDTSNGGYVFGKTNGEPMVVYNCSKIIQEAAEAVGIKRNVASHTMRKTFAVFQIKAHNDNAMFINELQKLLNHSSPDITLNYCGLDRERLVSYHNDVNLGLECHVLKTDTVVLDGSEKVVDAKDLEFMFRQLSESCYTCEHRICDNCYINVLAKKYGYDINTI